MPRRKRRIELGGVHYHRANACANSNSPDNTLMDPSHLSDDFREFLTCLNGVGVEYLIVGGHAVAYHGYVRPTRDMDIWVNVSPQNADKLVRAVRTFFGADLPGLDPAWFLDRDNVTRFGAVPNVIEILPKISGGEFSAAFARRVIADIDGQKVNIISISDLLANKRASARPKDLADLHELTSNP